MTPVEYQTKVPLSDNEVSDASGNAGATPAISNANALKADGSHILAIGVGAALQNAQSRQRLISVSGPDVFSGIGTFDIATDDAYLEPNFAELEDALRDAAFQLCAPSVNIRKLYDATPDPDSLDDAIPGVGWEMTGTVDSVPVPGSLRVGASQQRSFRDSWYSHNGNVGHRRRRIRHFPVDSDQPERHLHLPRDRGHAE